MTEEEYLNIIRSEEFLADYPMGLEDFGKDFLNSLSMLLDYKKSYENNIALIQSANSIRRYVLAATSNSIDITQLNSPYPPWKMDGTITVNYFGVTKNFGND